MPGLLDTVLTRVFDGMRRLHSASARDVASPARSHVEQAAPTRLPSWEGLSVDVLFEDDRHQTFVLKGSRQTVEVTIEGHHVGGKVQQVLAIWLTPDGRILLNCPVAGCHGVASVERKEEGSIELVLKEG